MAHLSIDFGTSSTVAVIDGRPVLFDGAPSLPSGVCADPAGRLLVGPDAAHAARTTPESYEPYPKQRVDEQSVLLGEVEVDVPDLFAAVLRRVLGQLTAAPRSVTITHPAAWGSRRREVLREAANRAGMRDVRLVSEPIAAAAHFAFTAGTSIPSGRSVVVYDLGAGTFDASVIRRTGDGFEVLATSGLSDGGGLDLDAAIVAHLGAVYAPKDPAAWERLMLPVSAADRRVSRAFWADVRTGKEMLSRSASTHIHVPLVETEAPLGRERFEALARPVIDRTVATTRAVLREAGVAESVLAGVLLVGGASRVPLVASTLHRALGVAPTVIEQPELAVAHGALRAGEISGTSAEATVRVARDQVQAGAGLAAVLNGPQVPFVPLTALAAAKRAGDAAARPGGAPSVPSPRPGGVPSVSSPRPVEPSVWSASPAAAHSPAPAPSLDSVGANDGETRPYARPGAPSGVAAVPTDLPPRKRRWPMVLVAVVVLAGAGTGYAVYRSDRGVEQSQDPGTAGPTVTVTTQAAALRNDAGEPLEDLVVQAVREANPDSPDIYRSLPGTDYAGRGPHAMVIESSSTSGDDLRLRIREAAAESGGPGPWWLATAVDAEYLTVDGDPAPLADFVTALPGAPRDKRYGITFDADLRITEIREF
ncbi:actin-like ATPase involved in cell morphogenesis [Catenuloplanes nepalensis]|uniref:Actin-like ATPase involved in cell morphogenesis n=1 Tax=Catenuloplanes nepalensis TaxID=587533 RepID=A0ABT9MTG6_9ACTN|nr:Hsp70 family protein [Catenuloplanes nepalensis]MDP9794727.1 actin-like ATPase involved in cell morphogenesis [Catenuloplanes nepalensis]